MSKIEKDFRPEDDVAKGAVLLDRLRPGWWREVVADGLAMETCDQCILGQLYGDYWGGCRTIAARLPSTFLFSSARHGFTLPDRLQPDWSPETLSRFAALADAWRAAIRARLAKDLVP